MTKIRIVPKGVPHYWAKYDTKGKLKPNAEQANFLSYFDDHAPTTYNIPAMPKSNSKMPKQSNDSPAAASSAINAQLPAYVRYLENLIGQVFGLWGFQQRAQLMLLFSQFANLQNMTDSEKKKLALKIEILFHEIYFVCSPFKNRRASQLGFFHIAVRFVAEHTKGELQPSELDPNKLLNLELMRMVNMSAKFAESESLPTIAEMDSLIEKVNNVCSKATAQECSNFALAERRKKRKRGHKVALVAITEDGMAPSKNSENLKKNERKQKSFANHLSNSKTESCEDEFSTTEEQTKLPEKANNLDSSQSSSSDSGSSENCISDGDETKTAVAEDKKNGAKNANSAADDAPAPCSTVEKESSAPTQPATEKANARTEANAAGVMAVTRKTTVGTRPRAGRKAKHPAKKVDAYTPNSWERKRAAPVETLTADKRMKLQEERDRETAAATRQLEHDLRLSSDESQNRMKEMSSVMAEIGTKNVEARRQYIRYRQVVGGMVSARNALREPNAALEPSPGLSVDQLLKSVELSGGLTFAVRRALQTLAVSLKQVNPALSLVAAYAGALLKTETAVRFLKIPAKREGNKAAVDKCIAECSYLQIWPEILRQYVSFLEQVATRTIDFARENEDVFKNSEHVAPKGSLVLPDQPGTIAYLKLLEQLLTSIRLTVSAVGKNGDVAAALEPLMANFQI